MKHSKIPMSAGQMLLAGFNGLFTKLESEVDTLLAAVQHVDPTLRMVLMYIRNPGTTGLYRYPAACMVVSEILAKD